jgi:hypothetical protein
MSNDPEPPGEGVLIGAGVFVVTMVLTFLLRSGDEGSSNWPVLTVWLAAFAVGIALLAFKRWEWGSAWLTGVVCAVFASLVLVALMG